MAIQPYNYETGATPTPAAKPTGRIAPFQYAPTPTPAPAPTPPIKPGILSRLLTPFGGHTPIPGATAPQIPSVIPDTLSKVGKFLTTPPVKPPAVSLYEATAPAPAAPPNDILSKSMRAIGSALAKPPSIPGTPLVRPGSELDTLAKTGSEASQQIQQKTARVAAPISGIIEHAAQGASESAAPMGTRKPLSLYDQVAGKKSQRNFGDVINMLPALIQSSGIPSGIQSIVEAIKGGAVGPLKYPALNDTQIVSSGVQTDYENRLKAGQSADQAFYGSALSLGVDLAFLLPFARGIGKLGVKTVSPETLLKQTTFETKSLREWLQTGKPMPADLQQAFRQLPSDMKAKVARGLVTQVLEPTPSKIGKILGVSEQEAKGILDKINALPPESPPLQLPSGKTPAEAPVVPENKGAIKPFDYTKTPAAIVPSAVGDLVPAQPSAPVPHPVENKPEAQPAASEVQPASPKAEATLADVVARIPNLDIRKTMQLASNISKASGSTEITPSAILEVAQYHDTSGLNTIKASRVLESGASGIESYLRAQQVGVEGLDKEFPNILSSIREKASGMTKNDNQLAQKIIEHYLAQDGKEFDTTALKRVDEFMTRARDLAGGKPPKAIHILEAAQPLAGAPAEPPKAPKTQKEKVAATVKEGPKNIKEIATETGIKEPNVRRILGVGAKEGTFERVDKGVYKLTVDGQDIAYVEVGDAVESLPRLAAEGFKSDMIFLDIPYKTDAVVGRNRPLGYETISPEQFDTVLKAVSVIARDDKSPVIHMYSNAPSGMKQMQKYNDLLLSNGFKPVALGQLQKTTKAGAPTTNVLGKESKPEGIIVFSKSGEVSKALGSLDYKLVRPTGYKTEKPAQLLKSLIEMTTNVGDTVLDPFAGSGVTGAEAVKLGRKSYLIEKDANVAEKITKSRVEAAAKEFSKNDLVEITDKTTGKSAKRVIVSKKDDGSFAVVNPDAPFIPTRVSLEKFDMKLIKKGDASGPSPVHKGFPINGPEAIRREGEDASLKSDLAGKEVEPAKSVDELKKKIDQLNKFAQSHAILRRTGGLRKKALGVFRSIPKKERDRIEALNSAKGNKKLSEIPPRGIVHLQNDVVQSPRQYMETLAHELGHALEYTLTGATNKDTFRVFGKDLTKEEVETIRNELKENTNRMVGEAEAKAGAGYYYKNTELLARFLENMFAKPGDVAEYTPIALKYLEQSALETPIIEEYLNAVYGKIDKGQASYHLFFSDMRETFMKPVEKGGLGAYVGEQAWNDIVRHRALEARGKIEMEKLVESKFKNVKDDPQNLYRAAESIKVTEGGVPQFGTRDFVSTGNKKEAMQLLNTGWEPVLDEKGEPVYEIVDGKPEVRFAKQRYTPAEAKRIFNSLSPEGQQLVKDFTASIDERKDFFNREIIKDVYKITSNLEGWVHQYWDENAVGVGGKKLKLKIASAAKHRSIPGTASEKGAVEDLRKAMIKSLTELESAKVYNNFIDDFFARVSRPIAEGESPMPGYVEVQGTVRKGGVGRPGDVRKIIVENGKAVVAKSVRYQMPERIYERFQLIRGLAVEASKAAKIMNSINRYWRVNILFYPGSAATNAISGGLQYSTKVLTDLSVELLTGNASLPKTRANMYAMLTTLTPRGWQAAPDWIYGGDLSNWYGEFSSKKAPGVSGPQNSSIKLTGFDTVESLNKSIDKYADKVLKLYGMVERYWKKVIATAEGSSDLHSLGQMTRDGLRLPTDEEKELLDAINKEIDLLAYDYDNVAKWIQTHQQSGPGQSIKPFAKYPYKYAKQWTQLIEAAFDPTLDWKERVGKTTSLAVLMAIIAGVIAKKASDQKTPEVGTNAPPSVSTRGRLLMGTDNQGKEVFTRVAKYPFVNVTDAGMELSKGHFDTAAQLMNDMIGSISPIGDVALAALGYGNQYQQYLPVAARIGQDVATFVPASRMLADVARFFDPYQRKQTTFMQAFGSLVPTTDAALQEKLHGTMKTLQVPLRGSITSQPGDKTTREITDIPVQNYKTDLLLGFLAGLYETRIDPEVAKAYNIREAELQAASKARAEKAALKKNLGL